MIERKFCLFGRKVKWGLLLMLNCEFVFYFMYVVYKNYLIFKVFDGFLINSGYELIKFDFM